MIHSSPPEARSSQSRFFAYVQDTAWYREFLMPVVTSLSDLAPQSRVLDVGTGPGRLLALVQQQLGQEVALECVGIDADPAMVAEARRRPDLRDVELAQVPVGQSLPFPSHTFNAICFCSVLYLLGTEDVFGLLHEAKRLLRQQGRIVILTPSGSEGPNRPRRSITGRQWFHVTHWTFALWRRLTAAAGRQWQTAHLARNFAQREGLTYACYLVFSDLATIEVMSLA